MGEWERDPDERYRDDRDDPYDSYDEEGDAYDYVLDDVAESNVREYLGKYGDAINERVSGCTAEAEALLSNGFPGAALIAATTAMELIIAYFLLRPLVQGAFLSDEWADLLTKRVLSGRVGVYQRLLPKIARPWGIDIVGITLGDGRKLWETYLDVVRKARDQYVHVGAPVSEADACTALECARGLMLSLVEPMARKFGMSWPESGSWHEVKRGVGGGEENQEFSPDSPF